jgi:hypothetical protein
LPKLPPSSKPRAFSQHPADPTDNSAAIILRAFALIDAAIRWTLVSGKVANTPKRDHLGGGSKGVTVTVSVTRGMTVTSKPLSKPDAPDALK